jgi:Fe-S-cluster containining protein
LNTPADPLWSQWFAAAREPAIDAGLRRVYDQLADAIRQRAPVCWTSGKCCNFQAYGHRLYVTGLEIAWMLPQVAPLPPAEAWPPGVCPFQVDKLCSVHAVRPLGCRIFFCQRGTEDWQHEWYERLLGELRGLHDEHGLEYRYMEWLAGLREARVFAHST